MRSRIFILIVFLSYFSVANSQVLKQKIKGVVLDQSSNIPIAKATIRIESQQIFSVSDSNGNFVLADVPLGRFDLEITCAGYESSLIKEIEVNSAKEVFLNISLRQKISKLGEIKFSAQVNKQSPLNNLATVSAKMLSVEEAKRYAGGFDDPARLVSAFAGVSSNVNNNAIMVRGNSPKSLQWKLEGVEIANPNHFADLSAFGGGGLSGLSSQLLANSDFLTGAFPAEYSNALSGVFDINMRKGNASKREHAIQIGITGIDFASEGPFTKKSKSSYLFNYRYSTLTLLAPILPDNGGGVKYQDLSFKLNFPTKKYGTFSVWGIGLIDGSGQNANLDSTKWYTILDKQVQEAQQFMGSLGLAQKYFINNRTYIKTTLATSFSGINFFTDNITKTLQQEPKSSIANKSINWVLSSFINTKYSARHTNKSGISATKMGYRLQLKNALNPGVLQTIVDEDGTSFLISGYTNSNYNLSDNLLVNVGAVFQLFTLNNRYTIEPRAGLKYTLSNKQILSVGYGMHSRLERMNYYFGKHPITGSYINKNLDFTKAHHLVVGYDNNISKYLHLKMEPYYQYLFAVPVIEDSSFSFINLQNDWFFNQPLVNKGTGRNIGIDISLDHYMNKGLYYLATASLFDSKYKGGDNIWRNTRFNRNYAANFLIGKEWNLPGSKNRKLGVNGRANYQGGDRYSPINTAASLQQQEVIFDESRAFDAQIAPSFTTHFTVLYKTNKARSTRELALKLINATQFKEFYHFEFNFKTQQVQEHREAIFIPNLSYKVEF